jgi:Sec-independent protein translocase protein TatA
VVGTKDFRILFATPGKTFRRNRQMTNALQKEAEMKDLNQEKSFTAPSKAEINEETSMSIKDPDTMLSMTVLLLACLALAVLAHVFV